MDKQRAGRGSRALSDGDEHARMASDSDDSRAVFMIFHLDGGVRNMVFVHRNPGYVPAACIRVAE